MKKFIAVFTFFLLVVLTVPGCTTAHEHVWVEAGCVAPKHCEVCGLTVGEAVGHDWKDADCTSPKKCSRCGITEGSALGHDLPAASCEAEAVCRRCGLTLAALGHDWQETCGAPKTCTRCGATEGSVLEHSWLEASCLTPKICSRCGVTEGSALGHDWAEASCLNPKTCARCGITEGSALGHSFSEGKCVRCGENDPNYVPPQTYDHNLCYDLVEEGSYKNSIGTTYVIHKVLAKKDCTVEGTLLAFDAAGNVLAKSTDTIVLTAGQYNYFSYMASADVSSAKLTFTVKERSESILPPDRSNVVELVQYNKSGDSLYLTLRLNGTEIDSLAQYKVLYYRNDRIVSAKDGYFSISAKNLSGNGSIDVAEIWSYGIDYDRIEYFYEP